tara:strand:- start:459 stop:3506 length:3048 start_codon:yes stop_codon:yes gene_type:complete
MPGYNYAANEVTINATPNDPSVTAEDIVITDFFDFSQITNVRTVRPPVIPGENADAPKMNGNELVLANISLNFLVNLNALDELKRQVGTNAAVLEVRLINDSERPPRTLAITALNISAMQSAGQASNVLPVSLNLVVDTAQVQSPNNVIQTVGGVIGAVSQDLGFAFTILRATGEEGNQIGPPVAGTGHFLPYDMDDDLNDYYVVRSPVKITAAATALDQSLVTLYKSATCNAESAVVFRRTISPEGVFGSFEFVTEIDFSGESDTLIDENYVVSFVDGNPEGFSGNPLPKIDNTFAHQYRVIPVGKRAGATPYIFRDAFTTPVSQASVSIGDNFRVLPIFNPKVNPKRSDQIRGYQLTDDNFLTPSSPMVSTKSDLAVITYRGPTNTGGVAVSVTGKKNPRTPVAIDFVRRDLTKNERRFTLIPSSRDVSTSPQQIVPVPSPGQQGTTFTMNFIDTTVVDGHTYEYAVRTYSKAGLTQLSEDTSVTTYFDPALLVSGEDLKLTTTSPVLSDGSITIDFEVEVPQNVISLLESLVNTRIGARESPFAQDIVAQRRNLSPQPAPIVRRLNRTTGREVDFKLMGSTARKFEQTNDPQEGVGIQNKFNFRFTDDELEPGSQYQYEILVNLRDPLSVTDEKTFVVPREREPYIFQSCKIFNPLFIGRGILPPTQRGQNFILQENINTGRDRLLNLLTAEDTWDLGRTSLQALVPNEPITVPLTRAHVRAPVAQRTRVGEASVSWSVRGDLSDIDHYRIYSKDSYVDQDRNVMIKKSLVANIPAQVSKELTVKSRLKTLTEEDAAQFLPRNVAPLSMLDLQRLVDLHEVTVKRSYDIVVINSRGLIESVAETRPVEIWSSRLNKLSPLSDRDLVYVIPPSTVFSEGNKSNGSEPLDVQSQAEETRQASGYGQAASSFAQNTRDANAYIADQQVVGDNAVANTYTNTAVGGNSQTASGQAENAGYDENAGKFGDNAPGMKSPPPGGNKNNGSGGTVSLADLDPANSGHGQDFENNNFKWST